MRFDYDDRGRRTALVRGNGAVTGYGYDAASRLTALTHDLAGTAADVTLAFSHNPAGQIVGNQRSNDAYALLGTGGATGTVNGLNQLTAQNGTGFSFDARGNMTFVGVGSFGSTKRRF